MTVIPPDYSNGPWDLVQYWPAHDFEDDCAIRRWFEILGISIHEVPYIGCHKHRKSYDLVVSKLYLPMLCTLVKCINHPYDPTLPTKGEVNVYGISEANRRVRDDFFDNLNKARCLEATRGPLLCYNAALRKFERRCLVSDAEVEYSVTCSL